MNPEQVTEFGGWKELGMTREVDGLVFIHVLEVDLLGFYPWFRCSGEANVANMAIIQLAGKPSIHP